jgi:hypothetical protein
MSVKDKKRTEEIKSLLLSGDNEKVLTAIERLDECPSAELVQPLLVVYASNSDPEVKMKLNEVLTTLKVSGLEDMFIKAIQAKEFAHCRKDLIHFMWSSNIQPVEGWMHIAELAANGTFEECIEVLSLLDNTEQELLEEELLAAVSILTMALNEQPDDEAAPIRKVLLEGFSDRLNQ